jgi:ComF family protein
LGGAALDVLLPPTCLTCDEPVDAQGRFCARCFRKTDFVVEPFCRRCGVPFANAGQGGAERLCPACREDPPGFDRARAAFRYDWQARRMVLPFKHGDRTELANGLAIHMARAGAPLLADATLLVPVPLHRRRLFQRRYNQAALLARALGRRAARAVAADALRRVRATASLDAKSAGERAAELDGAIAVRPARLTRIAGQHVLLIDDVMTSGATANECARVLKAAGAVAVDVLVAARVPDPRLS